ncbi:MAG TPA: AbrB/MazE/SpoVT family DNA-binding domain-containing protein [Verrucomicrobiales bacterium]|jgi:hypothetical protein|nr:AbrB/MazE/SpoVT family DNA-binding domain-containing protein [Verrucomicrobiales bacterium]
MTAILNQNGQIVLPPEANKEACLQPGTRFDVTVSVAGDILLRRERKRHQTLLEHFEAMRGLTVERRRDAIPPPLLL